MKDRVSGRYAIVVVAIVCSVALAACTTGGGGQGGLIPKEYDGSLIVAPSPVDFEPVRLGCVATATLDILNTSADVPVVISQMTLPDPSLGLSRSLPIELEPGERRSLTLHFSPDAAGTHSGVLRFVTDEGRLHPLELPITGTAETREPSAVSTGPIAPLDLVFVLDVSTSMNELAQLRTAILSAFDAAESRGIDARFGLTTFENDVLVHREAAFLPRSELLAELDSQLIEGSYVPNPDLPRQLLNFDYPENILGALSSAAREFEFRSDARRFFVLMTDDTFLEPPRVFSDGTPATHGYSETADDLRANGIRLFSVHAPLKGRGLSSQYEGAPSLVDSTGGAWFEIDDVDKGSLALDALLDDLLSDRTCS